DESSRRADEREWIAASDSKEPALNHRRRARRSDQPDDDADHGEHGPFAQHQPKYVGLARAKGDAHAEFLRALRDGIRDDAIDADDREHQRERREAAEQ